MKTVIYFGQSFDIPDQHTYIATDCDGTVYSYPCAPFLKCGFWLTEKDATHEDGPFYLSVGGAFSLPDNIKWSDSLIDVSVKMPPWVERVPVSYFGHTVYVHPHHTHIATDQDGDVYTYSVEPKWSGETGELLPYAQWELQGDSQLAYIGCRPDEIAPCDSLAVISELLIVEGA